MRLVGATVVRNEADVIEIFVRHNLTALDGIAVVDHGSIDGTTEILAELVREGLPLFVARDDTPEFDQKAIMNRLVRHVFATSDAAWIFALDADEFLKIKSRGHLEEQLRALPPGHPALLEWQTYVPRFDNGAGVAAALRAARRLAQERHQFAKAVLAREFADTPGLSLTAGNHGVVLNGPPPTPIRGFRLSPDAAALAHFPVRSAAQFTAKVAVGWLARVASGTPKGNESFHLREAFGYLRSGRPLTPLQLNAFAANYSVPQDRWLPVDGIALVEDPFLGEGGLLYTHLACSEPLALVLAHAEQLLAARRY